MNKIFILLSITIYISGCAWLVDSPKTLWGSSIRVLSDQRADAETRTFSCAKEECFQVVENLTVSHADDINSGKDKGADIDDYNNKNLVLFARDVEKRYMIVMNVPNALDTTEVGIFFDEEEGRTTIDVTSLSSRAKKIAADIIFKKLSEIYSLN